MQWRKCPSWPEYEVSEVGDVRRVVKRFGNVGLRTPYRVKSGYLYLVMRSAGKQMAVAVHRLVAEAFIGAAPSPEHEVAHRDGQRASNHWTNLRWATRSENQMDRVEHGTSNRGERFARVRLTEQQVLEIKLDLGRGVIARTLAERYAVATTTIKAIKLGRSWAWLTIAEAA